MLLVFQIKKKKSCITKFTLNFLVIGDSSPNFYQNYPNNLYNSYSLFLKQRKRESEQVVCLNHGSTLGKPVPFCILNIGITASKLFVVTEKEKGRFGIM